MNMEPNNLNEWWGGQPDELKQAFSLFPDRRWEGADLHLLPKYPQLLPPEERRVAFRRRPLDAQRDCQ